MKLQKKTVSTWIIALIVVVLLGGLLAYLISNKTEDDDDDDDFSKTPVVSNAVSPQSSASTATDTYKNGTYNAIGGYDSPAGWDTLNVSLTLANGVVTNVVVTPDVVVSGSKRWVERFISGINQVVVGRNINDLNLTQVSGASLTTGGFNDAVAKIKVQAKA